MHSSNLSRNRPVVPAAAAQAERWGQEHSGRRQLCEADRLGWTAIPRGADTRCPHEKPLWEVKPTPCMAELFSVSDCPCPCEDNPNPWASNVPTAARGSQPPPRWGGSSFHPTGSRSPCPAVASPLHTPQGCSHPGAPGSRTAPRTPRSSCVTMAGQQPPAQSKDSWTGCRSSGCSPGRTSWCLLTL